jgi:NTP pyrophosphatase (non-canonical NTP hydrolase)
MKLLMHILRKNDKLKIDNTVITFGEITTKLTEEYIEVVEAILRYNKSKCLSNLKEVVRETFDLIQMCILILWRCHRKALDLDEPNLIQDINIEHKDKLVGRAWTIETGIEIDVKE